MVPCVYFLSLPEQGEDPPRDSECNQRRKHPGWGTEQEGHSLVVPKCGDEGGEERVE